jgi:amino acid adenylation domain-containing protein
VVVEHRQLAALLASVQSAFGFGAGDRMPCVAPFSFDIFLFELLAPLLAGGTSVLVGLRPSIDVDRLVARFGEMTRLHAVPALMRQICDTARRTGGTWPEMRSLFVGGDRVPADLLDDLRPVFPNAEIHVLYGPTEATILATSHQAQPGETGSPIGRPFEHVEILVADAAGRPVPIGVPGEIRIGGAGVARGYLNRPELNEEKFPAIFSGKTVYRSGDLARWRPDGVLEFLGRTDDQIKVRGFRIEPGEVEAAIARGPGVRAAAVLAVDGRLAAFVVPSEEEGLDLAGLQEALRAELPEYMVPGSWRLLTELPLTAHGKVDRGALAALGEAIPEEAPGAEEAPQGEVEEAIAAVFADILGRERVGRRTSFFDLGGHSLLAMQVVSRVRAALGIELPLVALFDAPTVAGMAAAVEDALGLKPALPPLVPSMETGDAPLSFAQQRLWFLDRLEPGTATYNLPVAVRLRGALEVEALESALAEIVRRHQALRTTFHEGESGPVQRIAPEGPFALAAEDLSSLGEAAEAAAFRRLAEEAMRPFDLETGPVFRAFLLRLAPDNLPGDHLLIANLHHIVSDGWSMGVLVRELSSLYRGAPLPELPVQYTDWARWQRRWLAGEVLQAELGWWRQELQGLPGQLDLPIDRPRSGVERRRGVRLPVRLGRELTRDLAALARREGATLFTLVLAGFQALLAARSGQDDLAVGSPVAGRTQVEVEGLIGFFANTLVLRSDLRADPGGYPSGYELLRRTRARVLAAHEHQNLPFERLVEELAPARQLGRTPLFEVMLAFQSAGAEPPDLPGIAAELVPVETGTAKLDLLLDLSERDGELTGSLEHDADLFDAVTIDRLVTQFAALLRGLATAPGERISDLLLLAGVERRQIAAVQNVSPSTPAAWEPPQGKLEEEVAAIWAEVLDREEIGRHDSFFDRGGHSLLGVQIVSRVRKAFGVEIPLRALFEEPTVAGLARRIAAAAGEEGPEPISGAAGAGPAPLSFAQQRLWFLSQLDPASPVYNLPAAVRLRGSLDVAALEHALAVVVRRHESLRTRFPVLAGEPVQVVDAAPAGLPSIDLRALGRQAEAAARRIELGEATRPFDLQNGPLFRALLLRVADHEHQLLITMHHIISDGWSLGVFVRELTALYAGLPLQELPVRYRDFAVWQRAHLSGEPLERSLAFWRDELRGLPPGIDLPTDRPRPPLQTFRGALRPFTLEAATTGRLRELARSEGATLFMVLLAGFEALLARWSGQEDLAVGSPVAGRSRLELEGLIGFFVNTLVLRGDLTGDPDVRTLVRRARERFLAAQAHQDIPFEKLVEELKPERNLARPPLFQVLLVLQNAPRAPFALPGLAVAPEPVETGTAKFEIQLTLEEIDGGGLSGTLGGALDYNRDLFDASTMDRLLGQLSTLLASAVAAPDGRALELEILTARERQQILWEWNPSERFPRERPVHEMFAEQAALRPQATAVVCGEERITYGDLDRQANALARRLRRLGVGPEERVAICLERSVGMMVGILGILKAGGAYVPLDPEHPAERQSLVLADSQARAFITHSDLVGRLAPPEDLPLILWDREKDAIAGEDGSPLGNPGEIGVCSANAQYVIYTSGSTGRPKGVVLTHSEVTRLLAATDHWFHFGPDDVWALFFSFAFDFSVWEIWGALALGGRLVIAPYWVSRTPSALYDMVANERVTVLNQTPSAFRGIVQAEGDLPAPRDLALRWVIFGGEALDPAILGPWFERHDDQMPQMINMYGITETTVHVTWRRMTAADVPKAPVSPVGGPMPDLQLYILDPRQLPAPVGVPGEMCVGGDGLARGYFRRPDLTAARFIPDPFGGRPGARLYRSGDLARLLPDGDVEYLGRIDFQVKIRGFRIELGEIEAVLASFPAVRDAVVLAREDRSGDRRLVAWVVPQPETELRVEDLRGFLRGRLPEYMVPSAFVVLEALPLTANGKLDRRALPEPQARSAAPAVLPRTATEEAIATVWREALGLETVGVEDSFFDLGGHSLLVVQVHRRLAPQFPELAIVDLFRYPTISALAGYLSREKVDQISLQETRERAEDRTDRAKRQRELRRQARGR